MWAIFVQLKLISAVGERDSDERNSFSATRGQLCLRDQLQQSRWREKFGSQSNVYYASNTHRHNNDNTCVRSNDNHNHVNDNDNICILRFVSF